MVRTSSQRKNRAGARWRTTTFVGVVLTVCVACGRDTVSATAPTNVAACVPPTLWEDGLTVSLAPEDIREALRHAALTLLPIVDARDSEGPLHDALVTLASESPLTVESACRTMEVAVNAMRALPQVPETLPERQGIEFVLHLARQFATR